MSQRLTGPSTGDVIAGLSVAMVAIPQSLAYAELAGLPAQLGLYASALPSLLAAFFVSSRYLQTGPVALTSLLTLGALSGLAATGSDDYISLAALLALLVGGMRLVFGLVRLGSLAYLLSEPVLTGFTTGAAILIVSSQLPRVFDVESTGGNVLANAARAVVSLNDWDPAALAFALGAAVVIVGGRRLHRLFPGVLVAVIGGTIISTITGYSGSKVGELEGGFVSLGLDLPWSSAADLIVPALAIALVGFAEPSSIARTFAAEERQPWDANREMVSQGVANLAAAVSGAFPVGGSFSRSSLNRLAGATSAWSGAITGGFVLLALPLTPLLAELPSAILGAIVIVAVVKLVKITELVELGYQSVPQAAVGIGTLAMTLAFSPRVERGVLVGVGLALAVHLYRELNITARSELEGATLTVAPQGVLWFASVSQIDRVIRAEIAAHPDVTTVVLDLVGVGRLDYTGAAAMRRIVNELLTAGTSVDIINVPPGAAKAAEVHLQTGEPSLDANPQRP
ncbi:MAG: SulP family inorganic anion transporter [Acidimicrobiia bacterium]|nr:SulP family inorganic anion transporter [Acidimicrobiia bacterium]